MRLALLLPALLVALPCLAGELKYAPPPADNPLRGLVPYPYIEDLETFPHSMEFDYIGLNKLMSKEGTEYRFNWKPLEAKLEAARARGNQMIFRVILEYPGKKTMVPDFLIKEGLKLHRYQSGDGACITPDYTDKRLTEALRVFIEALGKRYDGDPRIGFITAGLLGHWGEWHTHPREDLYPPKEIQRRLGIAYHTHFFKTPVLFRYPAGPNDWHYAENSGGRQGFHDDSFAWATLDTGNKEDDWFFVPKLKAAKAQEAWRRAPIGGEIRPELWSCLFTEKGCPRGQDFARCVEETHASWLMDTGMFEPSKFPRPPERVERALKATAKLGYNYQVTKWEIMPLQAWELAAEKPPTEPTMIRITIKNHGVAPFYHFWPIHIGQVEDDGRVTDLGAVQRLPRLAPGQRALRAIQLKGASGRIAIRVPNPMKGGKPFRFANETQTQDGEAWLHLEKERE